MTDETRKKVLIVDDDKFLLDMYTIKFTENNFDVTAALGSVEALGKIKEGIDPDVALLDVVMPAMDGFELLETIKRDKLAPRAKVIILSNLGQQSDIDKGNALGADGYIVKANATPSEVVEKVKEILTH
ncbi:MAG: Response regulator receiver domain protein [Candidatus Giovannonibacteria bacterium GW2011_GWB1_46_20]|nr:MAG: Response regulator receiver domain protein [Candidatus Giovannonibacteria bacterium GW2011_GWB1_46_20]